MVARHTWSVPKAWTAGHCKLRSSRPSHHLLACDSVFNHIRAFTALKLDKWMLMSINSNSIDGYGRRIQRDSFSLKPRPNLTIYRWSYEGSQFEKYLEKPMKRDEVELYLGRCFLRSLDLIYCQCMSLATLGGCIYFGGAQRSIASNLKGANNHQEDNRLVVCRIL